jgi:hypothetical protein
VGSSVRSPEEMKEAFSGVPPLPSTAFQAGPGLATAGQRLIEETNATLNSRRDLARRGAERPLVVIVGPSKIDGGVSRVVKRDGGSMRVETWEPGTGWVIGGASLDEFIPGACMPVSPELAKRLGIPDSELDPGEPG